MGEKKLTKVIDGTAVLARQDLEQFNEELSGIVNEFQKNGLTVEIQYKPNDKGHAALIVGYKEKGR